MPPGEANFADHTQGTQEGVKSLFLRRPNAALNLVTRVADDPLAEAEQLAEAIKTRSPDGISAAKALFQQTWNVPEAQAFDTESKLQFKLLRGKNYRRALQAGQKKEKPQFGPRERDY